MLVQVRTALWSLLQVNLLHTVRRVTHHKLLLSLLVMTAAIVVGTSGPWQSHGDSLNLQEADKAVGIHDSLTPTLDYCSAILLLFVLIGDGGACVELGLLDHKRGRLLLS
jgi:hypothetical protein